MMFNWPTSSDGILTPGQSGGWAVRIMILAGRETLLAFLGSVQSRDAIITLKIVICNNGKQEARRLSPRRLTAGLRFDMTWRRIMALGCRNDAHDRPPLKPARDRSPLPPYRGAY